ncbi:MAG: helix-turn-helix domain-containing protein [Burkholderiaceae bacterium]
MRISITQPAELGSLVRATRKAQKLRQDDAAGAIGVSDVFLMRLENGAPGARLDKILQVLNELGIVLYADMSDDVSQQYLDLMSKKKSTVQSNSVAKANDA